MVRENGWMDIPPGKTQQANTFAAMLAKSQICQHRLTCQLNLSHLISHFYSKLDQNGQNRHQGLFNDFFLSLQFRLQTIL